MAQYPRVPMPAINIDPMGSILDVMRMAQASEQQTRQRKADVRADRDQAMQEEKYARENADRAAIDRVGSPQFAQEIATGSPGWQGPIDPSTPPPRPTDDQILSALPAHLRPVVQGQFRAAAEDARKAQTSILNLKEAQRKAVTDVNEHLAGLGYSIAQWGYDPKAVQWTLDHAKITYADAPDILSEIDVAEQAFKQDPAQIKTVVADLVSKSPRYLGLLQKEGATTEIELATTAATDPDPEKRANAQKVLDALEKHKRGAAAPRATSEFDDFQAEKDPVKRANILADRATFSAAGREPKVDDATKAATISQKAQAERDKENRLDDLEKRFRASQPVNGQPRVDAQYQPIVPMTAAELEAEKAKIQRSYLAQIGQPASRSSAPVPAQVAPPAGRGAVPSTGQTYRVGQSVTLKDGRTIIVKEVSPDGKRFR